MAFNIMSFHCNSGEYKTRVLPSARIMAEWNWKQSLPGCLTPSPQNVITHLLGHRPEFQENAYLSEEDKEKVEFIKCSFYMQR